MGYYIEQTDSKFFIAHTDVEKALSAIKGIMHSHDQMRGGSWGPDGKTERWYAWVNTDEVLQSQTLVDALESWRWKARTDSVGNVCGIEFVGEKSGQDELLFDAIAPYVESGSYIVMRGEDGEVWRWYFEEGTCSEQAGRISYHFAS